MNSPQLTTSLHSWHVKNGARMVDFAGWEMPIQYSSIMDEHNATRNQATLFDVSHMGRIDLRGPESETFMDRLTTRKVNGMPAGRIRYSLVCKADGGILDDILVYKPSGQQQDLMLVVNASNRIKILSWLEAKRAEYGHDIEIVDSTNESSMIAFQGPRSVEKINRLLNFDFSELKYFNCRYTSIAGMELLLSRTGYTGEDGCEIIVPNAMANPVWELLHDDHEVTAAGLAARDTLRLEAAMPLYGHELSESINAAQTQLEFAISMKDREFVGKSAIERATQNSTLPIRVGLILEGKRAGREGATILVNDHAVGQVTSGTFSPTLQQPIAMGYITREYAELGNAVFVDIRGKQIAATVSELPFYKR
ncbi:MAG: glycine cleavage system aminomethyltransferase GcvT [Planctomycetota bacterium]|nr:glycine cleavage system aminomethyltransferase GcvT [Planctomycetota bacterium]